MIIKNFEEFNEQFGRVVRESDNLPPGISDPGDDSEMGKKVGPEINIDPSRHTLKLVKIAGMGSATDHSELAILKDGSGSMYVLQFDASDDQFDPYKDREIVGEDYDEDGNKEYDYDYLELSDDAVQAIANDIPQNERGDGLKDMSRKDLVKLDAESAQSLMKEMEDLIASVDPRIRKPYEIMKAALDQMLM